MTRTSGFTALAVAILVGVAATQVRWGTPPYFDSVEELVAALETDEEAALSFISDAVGSIRVYDHRGNSIVRQCRDGNIASAEDLVPGIRAWTPGTDELPHTASLAIGRALDDFCAAALGDETATTPR